MKQVSNQAYRTVIIANKHKQLLFTRKLESKENANQNTVRPTKLVISGQLFFFFFFRFFTFHFKAAPYQIDVIKNLLGNQKYSSQEKEEEWGECIHHIA